MSPLLKQLPEVPGTAKSAVQLLQLASSSAQCINAAMHQNTLFDSMATPL
jgi:hypothetical protein